MLVIKCDTFKNFTQKEMLIAKQGLAILEQCLNSLDFREMFFNAQFTYTNGKTKVEIWDMLMSGADMIDKRDDGVMNLAFEMYYSWWSRVVGWVTPGKRTVHVNRKYFGQAVDFASNALHEYAHLVGLDHRSARDYGSVPYKLNALFELWCEKHQIA